MTTIDINNYENYLNERGEIDEDLLREDLQKLYAPQIKAEIAERLEDEWEAERELVNDDGTSTFLTDDEMPDRDTMEAEIRDEVEHEYEFHVEEVLEDIMEEFEEQMDSGSKEDGYED